MSLMLFLKRRQQRAKSQEPIGNSSLVYIFIFLGRFLDLILGGKSRFFQKEATPFEKATLRPPRFFKNLGGRVVAF